MGNVNFGGLPDDSIFGGDPKDVRRVVQSLIDQVAMMQKTVEFQLNGQLDSTNAREFGGWQIKMDRIVAKTGKVGMLSAEAGANDVRFWAGGNVPDEAPFRVTEQGDIIAERGTITGATIQNHYDEPGRLWLDALGFHVNDLAGNTRIEIANSFVGGSRELLFFGDSGGVGTLTNRSDVLGSAFYMGGPGGQVIGLLDNGDIVAQAQAGRTFKANAYSFNGSSVTGLQINHVTGLQDYLNSLQTQINDLNSLKSNIGHTHSVTLPNHNHGSTTLTPSGGGTFTAT